MNDLVSLKCLKEIEKPHIFHSQLFINNKTTRYCVLAENNFIIFKKENDLISLHRIPVNKSTTFEFRDSEFSISYFNFSFKFMHQSKDIILKWKDYLMGTAREDACEIISHFYAEMVQIDQFKNNECPVVISKSGWKLFIYESYDYQRADICTHVINLGYYNIISQQIREAMLPSSSRVLIIKGFLIDFKLIFETTQKALEWSDILRCSKENYLKSLTERAIIDELYKNESNKFCADCGLQDPTWVSINICVTLCENCIGIHRQLGTKISRTQSALMDDRCWSDCLLIKLLNIVGNENANKFWIRNAPVDNLMVNVERKYKMKEFIDATYLNLSSDEIVEKLLESVTTDDVLLTMSLWFSSRVSFSREVADQLLARAKQFNQTLQEKFLSLQGNITDLSIQSQTSLIPVFEAVFHLSHNKAETMSSLFLVSLYGDRFVIEADTHDILLKETVDICTVYHSYIDVLSMDFAKNVLQLSFYPECKFMVPGSERSLSFIYNNISRLVLYDSSTGSSLKQFYRHLLGFLWSSDVDPIPGSGTTLFLRTEIQINKEEPATCRCHVTNHELIVGPPIMIRYDLFTMVEVNVVAAGGSVVLTWPHCDLTVRSRDSVQTILAAVREASKIKSLSLKSPVFQSTIEKLINFIKFFGLDFDGVFRTDIDQSELVDELYREVTDAELGFSVPAGKYSVAVVASCLKKCFADLREPLVSEQMFLGLKSALEEETKECLFKTALKGMPENIYRVLRILIELLFMIVKRTKNNGMTSADLARDTASSFIPNRNGDTVTCDKILQYLVDNFQTLFEYSEKEKEGLDKFLQTLETSPQKYITRQIFIDLSLTAVFQANKFRLVEKKKPPNLTNIAVCMAVTVRIDECRTVADLLGELFNNLDKRKIQLWLFVFLRNKLYKQLLYDTKSIDDVIVNRRKFPVTCTEDRTLEVLLLLPAEIISGTIGTMYRCNVKVDSRPCEVILTMPASLAIYALEHKSQVSVSQEPEYNLNLSDVTLYRSHDLNPGKMHILTNEDVVISCEFRKQVEYQEFFWHIDTFYLRNPTFGTMHETSTCLL